MGVWSWKTDACKAAWAEVGETLKAFETAAGFEGPAEILVAVGVKPESRKGR